MKIGPFTIKNYRSIKVLRIDNLKSVNVFFGKNNVGKSNILRALHLAFYCLKNDELYLPDTMFHNRNVYRPIEISVDLTLEDRFCNTEQVDHAITEEMDSILSATADGKLFGNAIKEVKEFVRNSKLFRPLKRLRLRTNLLADETTSDVGVSIKDLESDYAFDYGEYKTLYQRLSKLIDKKARDDTRRSLEPLFSELSVLGIDPDELHPFLRENGIFRLNHGEIRMMTSRLRRRITTLEDPGTRERAEEVFGQFIRQLRKPTGELEEPFAKTFGIVKKYFDSISDNFILIPNKEYLPKGPLNKQGGKQIEIFDTDGFMDRLASLIESPTKKERKLIREFNRIFGNSYGDIGELEIRKFREKVLALFDTGFTALPIENQGLGIQDLFLYLAHITLFDAAIIAIEEPEGSLSTENQRILRNIIEGVYSRSNKQVFISSHSEEFETSNSYVIELTKEGTREISRTKDERGYEKRIQDILIKRRLEEEKEAYRVLLEEVNEKQMALDILDHIDKLDDKKKVDPERISKQLGYKKDKVEEILREITRRRT